MRWNLRLKQLALFLALVFFPGIFLTSCCNTQNAPNETPVQQTGVHLYEWSGEPQSTLTFGDRWEFTIQQEPYCEETGSTTRLLCLDRSTGETQELDADFYHRDFLGLRTFSGLLGQEGVVLERTIPATLPDPELERVFFQVDEDGPSHLLTCAGVIYTGWVEDQEIVVSKTRPEHLFSDLVVAWLENGQSRTLPLLDGLQAYLGLDHAAISSLLCDLDQDPTALTLNKLLPLGEQEVFTTLPWDHLMRYLWAQANRTQTLSLGNWNGAELSLELIEHRTEDWIPFAVERIDVRLGDQVIQTIPPPERMPDAMGGSWSDHSCDGLFDYSPVYQEGSPMVIDLNFDGNLDFGLTSDWGFARNIAYVFYLWDPEREQFDGFQSFFSTLEADLSAQRLTEIEYGGNWGDTLRVYGWEDGQLVLLRR